MACRLLNNNNNNNNSFKVALDTVILEQANSSQACLVQLDRLCLRPSTPTTDKAHPRNIRTASTNSKWVRCSSSRRVRQPKIDRSFLIPEDDPTETVTRITA